LTPINTFSKSQVALMSLDAEFQADSQN